MKTRFFILASDVAVLFRFNQRLPAVLLAATVVDLTDVNVLLINRSFLAHLFMCKVVLRHFSLFVETFLTLAAFRSSLPVAELTVNAPAVLATLAVLPDATAVDLKDANAARKSTIFHFACIIKHLYQVNDSFVEIVPHASVRTASVPPRAAAPRDATVAVILAANVDPRLSMFPFSFTGYRFYRKTSTQLKTNSVVVSLLSGKCDCSSCKCNKACCGSGCDCCGTGECKCGANCQCGK